MKKALKQIFVRNFIGFTFMAFIGFLIVQGQIETTHIPAKSEFVDYSNVGNSLSVAQKKAIIKSRNSSVRIISVNMASGALAVSSGTYFKFKKDHYVLTTHHGIIGNCETIQIEADGHLHDCVSVIKKDPEKDYVIMAVSKIPSRQPIKFPNDFTSGREWKKSLSILNKLIYTGYPNSMGPATLEGTIMTFSGDEYINMFSYAWSGSSGSGVFDYNGKLVGYVMALDVGQTEFGVQVLENVLLVVPAYKVDFSVLYK